MIAAVSPSSMFYDDTYNTLKYANRAKDIKSSVSMLEFIGLFSKYNNTVLREGELFLLTIIISFTSVSKFCSVTSSFLQSTLHHACSRYRDGTAD